MFSLNHANRETRKKIKETVERKINSVLDKTVIQPTLPDDLITWAEQIRMIQGQGFSFTGRPYLPQIYRDTNKEIYIVKPRQIEITEYAVNWLLYNLTKNPGAVGLYITDRQDHVSVFSKLRLRSWGIEQSPVLKSMVKPGNVSWQPFRNGSHLYMHSAWPDFDKARSIPADFVIVDEIQSTNVEAIPVIKEALSKSRFGKFVGIGTGSVQDDQWWKLWHTGNQQEWDSTLNQWIAKNPLSEISSYHLTQYMVPWLSRESIEQKKAVYNPRRFTNEVEGWWYASALKPLIESDIRALFDQSLSFLLPKDVNKDLGPLYLGVDWGGGTHAFTVVWIWQLIDKAAPQFRLIYLERINEKSTEKQADEIIRLVDAYRIDQGLMDAGGGTRQVEKLEDRYAERMIKCSYVARPEKPFELVSEENRIVVDRTWAVESIIDLITRPTPPNATPRISIPAANPEFVDWIVDQFTCIEGESVSLSGGKKYVRYIHPPESPDDALHACMYAYLAWLTQEKSRWGYISA
jgi:Phage terminase large subunit (GpA)